MDLGVLLVHGIGEQKCGGTLTEFGTPLAEWLAERAREAGGSAEVLEATVTAAGDEPARATIALQTSACSQRWLFAESWWAESIAAPRFAELARWGLAIAPWTFGSHYGERLRREWAESEDWVLKPFRLAAGSLALLGGMILSIAVGVGLIVVRVLSVFPWQGWRDALAAIQLRVAGYLGDSYVFVARPIEFAAIVSKVRHDLSWLSARCRNVVVVAHSQGAAIACHALETAQCDNVHLVTFGSGLLKLEQQRLLRASPRLIAGAGLAVLGLPLTLIGLLILPRTAELLGTRAFDDAGILLMYLLFGVVLLSAGVVDFLHVRVPGSIKQLRDVLRQRVVSWRDFHASADPVPNGALPGADYPQSLEVHNFGSVIRDHNGYWENRDEFVSAVGNALLDCAEVPAEVPRVDVGKTRKARAQRVQLLGGIWFLTLFALAVLVIVYRVQWTSVLAWAASTVFPWTEARWRLQSIPIPGPRELWQSAGILVLAMISYAFARAGWEEWNHSEMGVVDRHCYRESAGFVFVMTLTAHLLVLLAGIGGGLMLWMFLGSLFWAMAAVLLTSDRAKDLKPPESGFEPYAARAWSFLIGLLVVVSAIVAFVSAVVKFGLRAKTAWPTMSIGLKVWYTTVAIGGGAFLAAIVATLIRDLARRLQRRRAEASRPAAPPVSPP